MKQYEHKDRPTFRLPGGDDPRKNLFFGILMIVVLFILVVVLSRSSLLGGESLAEYREKHPMETIEESSLGQ